jgi:hypothetical protein
MHIKQLYGIGASLNRLLMGAILKIKMQSCRPLGALHFISQWPARRKIRSRHSFYILLSVVMDNYFGKLQKCDAAWSVIYKVDVLNWYRR